MLDWYARERRDLPWRRTKDPYAIWLSEVMLQQTRVDAVVPYYHRFLADYPTVFALAEAPLDHVLARWSGLGYYRRARMLHAAARAVAAEGGRFPDTVDGLRAVPGIGPYTAGAIASIAFDRPAALVDGNVARVLARIFAVEDDVRGGPGLARIWRLAEELVPAEDAGAWNQALMELGATLCVPKDPRCMLCPARAACLARARGQERELPRLAPKKKPVPVRRAAVVAARGARVLLARRRAEGTFGGMWEPPSAEVRASDDPQPALEALVGAKLVHLERAGEIVHVLSHRRIHVDVFRAKRAAGPMPDASAEYDRFAWIELDRAAEAGVTGVTTFARKILAAARSQAIRSE